MIKDKKIVAIVGMPGSGKSEASDFFQKKGFDYIRLGQITLDEIKKQGLPPIEANERIIRELLRRKHGMAAFAKLNFSKIDEFKHDVIVDGLYSWEEYLAFKEKYPEMICLAIYACPKTRYERLEGRAKKHKNDVDLKFRSFSPEETRSRDRAEIEKLNKGGPIAMADFTIINEKSKKELIENLEKIFRKVNCPVLKAQDIPKG